MSDPVQQHYITRVYLKYFHIDSGENRSFVYCVDFSNKYNSTPKKKGINDKIFKKDKYYNDRRLVDRFALEKIFGQEFEPKYDTIMQSISQENDISESVVNELLIWLCISKLRSPYFRDNTERIINFLINAQGAYNPDYKKNLQIVIKKIIQKTNLRSYILIHF